MTLSLLFFKIKKQEIFILLLLFVYILASHLILHISITFFSILGSLLFWISIYYLSLGFFRLLFIFYTLLVGGLILLYPYSKINLSIVASIFESNTNEIIEYFISIYNFYFLLIFLYVLLGFFILFFVLKFGVDFYVSKRLNVIILFSCILVSFYKPFKEFIKGDCFSISNIRTYPVQVIVNISNITYDYFLQRKKLERGLEIKADWKINSVSAKYDNYVLVIGESMRADYMSLYGYPIETTPFLKQTNGIIFNNYIASAPNTQPSLLNSFYAKEYNDIKENEHIINLAISAGFN
ncbi:sulfatase-like hydrolase/transferase, partial [Bisgaard Taxon 45]